MSNDIEIIGLRSNSPIVFNSRVGYNSISEVQYPNKKRNRIIKMVISIALIVCIVASVAYFHPSNVSTRSESGDIKRTQHIHPNKVNDIGIISTCTSNEYELISGGETRKFELYAPSSATSDSSIIFVWHGFTANPSKIEAKIKMKLQAESNGWLVVYPFGSEWQFMGIPLTSFNGMGCCGEIADDVQFAKDIITYLEENHCGDINKVFSTGFSNGGYMTHRLFCEENLRDDGSTWFKALAPHSGGIGEYHGTLPPADNYIGCTPKRAVPILSFFGTADSSYDGSNSNPFNDAVYYSFDDTNAILRRLHACDPNDDIIYYPTESSRCTMNMECDVEYCSIIGMEHEWSGDNNTRNDIDATSKIVHFFISHGA